MADHGDGEIAPPPAYTTLDASSVFFRPVDPSDLDPIFALESASYPPDEAATYDKLSYRIQHAPGVFLVAVTSSSDVAVASSAAAASAVAGAAGNGDSNGGDAGAGGGASNGTSGSGTAETIVGFVCGTCSAGSKLAHETMSHHDPEGGLLCVHSVVVAPGRRRQGLATRMLRAYLQYVRATTPELTAVHLLCKDDLIKLYEGAGFRLLGPSDVVHGQDQWFEMAHTFDG